MSLHSSEAAGTTPSFRIEELRTFVESERTEVLASLISKKGGKESFLETLNTSLMRGFGLRYLLQDDPQDPSNNLTDEEQKLLEAILRHVGVTDEKIKRAKTPYVRIQTISAIPVQKCANQERIESLKLSSLENHLSPIPPSTKKYPSKSVLAIALAIGAAVSAIFSPTGRATLANISKIISHQFAALQKSGDQAVAQDLGLTTQRKDDIIRKWNTMQIDGAPVQCWQVLYCLRSFDNDHEIFDSQKAICVGQLRETIERALESMKNDFNQYLAVGNDEGNKNDLDMISGYRSANSEDQEIANRIENAIQLCREAPKYLGVSSEISAREMDLIAAYEIVLERAEYRLSSIPGTPKMESVRYDTRVLIDTIEYLRDRANSRPPQFFVRK